MRYVISLLIFICAISVFAQNTVVLNTTTTTTRIADREVPVGTTQE